jgi:flagellar basal-body rod protein FlgC
MIDPLLAAMKASSSGLSAQSTRMRVLSENLANAQSTGDTPGANPYQRKTISFENVMDSEYGVDLVKAERINRDPAPFRTEYQPGHPAADANGYVKLPNVNMLVELADMREASRSYTANAQVIRQTREMVSVTIDLLKV